MMPKKNVGVVYLLLKQDAEGNLTARQVHEDADSAEFGYGDAMIHLDPNEVALARNLIQSLKRKLEET